MKVILLDDVQKLGRRGEVRDVSDGYARNFLIPKKLALSATAGNLKNLDHIKKQAERQGRPDQGRCRGPARADRSAQLRGAATGLGGRQALRLGHLAGLVDFLEKNGVKVERKRVQLDEPIKSLGETAVVIRLHTDVTAQLKVSVVRE